ncbi:MAG: hypothetical protein KAJ03_05470 [Gammaproteobacteria bacterium]|nr:hypothetical protein [Gammaproteobacteria bacterium]
MIINITKTKLENVDTASDGLLRRIKNFKKILNATFDPTSKYIPLDDNDLITEIHRVARKVAYSLNEEGVQQAYIGQFRTVYCVAMENALKEYGIKARYL